MHQFNMPGKLLALTVNPSISPTDQPIQMPTSDPTILMTMPDLPTQEPTMIPEFIIMTISPVCSISLVITCETTYIYGYEIYCANILEPKEGEKCLLNMHYRHYIINNSGKEFITGLEREHEVETEDLFQNIRIRQMFLDSNYLLSVQEAATIYFFIGRVVEKS